jgi:predicted PurR-regulated permease PerM
VARFLELSYNEDLNFIDNLWAQLGIRTWFRGFALSFSNITINFLKNAFLAVLFMVFLLVEASSFKEKLEIAFSDTSNRIMKIANDIVRQVSRYMVAKFFISFVQGVLFFVILKWIGVEFAVLWGIFQFIMNFIPNIGSIAAGVCISAFSLIQFWPEPAPVLLVITMILIDNIITSIVDPKIVGDRVGISALVILVSLMIWGWIWGFTGMILAVPMTVMVRIVCENIPFLEPVSILLGTRKAAIVKRAEDNRNVSDQAGVPEVDI